MLHLLLNYNSLLMTQAVKVMVRCRPINKRQKQLNCQIVVDIDNKNNQVNLFRPGSDPKSFTFDHVFGPDSLQSYIYEQTAFSLVDSVIEGYNGTIFAYGQTGCGKTHTMMGSNESENSKGIIPRTFNQIITFINSQSDKKHLVQCSFIEIYNEEIHDLLGKNIKAKMDLKESPDRGVFVKDLTMNIVKTAAEMEYFMDIGFKNRATRETAMNKESSRSHSIFTIHIQSEELDQLGQEKFKAGKLNLVDLAGSQRQSKTHAVGDGMKEAAKINLSLSALGNVISALVDGKTSHIPYRDSKLTRLLQDSLGGNTKTIMIAAISPASDNYDQTLSTLRYASRAKFIQNKPIINQDPKDTLLRQYAEQIKALKMMLQGKMPMQPQILMNAAGGNEIQTKYIQMNRPDENLQNQLNSKQQRIRIQQQEKQKLKAQLQNLQKLISHDNSQTDKKELERMKKLKEKLKFQKKKQEEWKLQKKKREEELMAVEKNYKSLNQEVQQMRIKFKQIKQKYLQTLQQLRDIREEAERQKQELLDTIRVQQSEISKYSGICSMMLNPTQLEQIISQSEYNDETKEWVIIPFYYRERNINFPKLGNSKNNQLIDFERDKKEVVFKDMPRKQQLVGKMKGTYKISQVVKGAREHSGDGDLSSSNSYSNMQKQIKNKVAGPPINCRNMQTLAPIRIENEGRIEGKWKMGEDQIHSAGSASLHNNKQIKLSPIVIPGGGSKKDLGKYENWSYND